MDFRNDRSLLVKAEAYEVMINAAIARYPEECCGFMWGFEGKGVVSVATEVKNSASADREIFFCIDTVDYVAAENFAVQHGLSLLGVYHSHPLQRAIPSQKDLEVALPGFFYVIISIYDLQVREMRCWSVDQNDCLGEQIIKLNF